MVFDFQNSLTSFDIKKGIKKLNTAHFLKNEKNCIQQIGLHEILLPPECFISLYPSDGAVLLPA